MNNKQLGNKFENDLAEELGKKGFVIRCYPAPNGSQPFDLLAVINCQAFGIECKTSSNGRFDLSRVEDNQYYSIQKAYKSGLWVFFAFKVEGDDKVYGVEGKKILDLIDEDIKSIKITELEELWNLF